MPDGADGESFEPRWQAALDRLGRGSAVDGRREADPILAVLADRPATDISFRLNVGESRLRDQLVVDFYETTFLRDGRAASPRRLSLDEHAIGQMPNSEDRTLLELLVGNVGEDRSPIVSGGGSSFSRSLVRPGMYGHVLPRLCQTNRFSVAPEEGPLVWHGESRCSFHLSIRPDDRSAGAGPGGARDAGDAGDAGERRGWLLTGILRFQAAIREVASADAAAFSDFASDDVELAEPLSLALAPVPEETAEVVSSVLGSTVGADAAALDAFATADVLSLDSVRLCLTTGFCIAGNRLFRVSSEGGLEWLYRLHRNGPVAIPADALDAFVGQLATMKGLPPVEFAPESRWSEATLEPRPRLLVSMRSDADAGAGAGTGASDREAWAHVSFDYSGQIIAASAESRVLVDPVSRRWVRRDMAAEAEHLVRLKALGATPVDPKDRAHGEVRFEVLRVAGIERELLTEGWHVEDDGACLRKARDFELDVSSGIDWFDLNGTVDFDGVAASLSSVLAAAIANEREVVLEDGSRGLVPDWARKLAILAGASCLKEGKLRFSSAQAPVVDALVSECSSATLDLKFEQIRRNFSCLPSARSVSEPDGFNGKLREYQRQGLGWMQFLEMFRFGGCLADDMGLGKTVQVTALLAGRHLATRRRRPPSIVIVPRSLVHNWTSELSRFAPGLSVVDYTGPGRDFSAIEAADVVVTTYGVVRREIEALEGIRFESVILDEAQAIKNPHSSVSKAARQLRAAHRLAVSGTPVENRLEELWSIFEFLNPGMLGSLQDFVARTKAGDDESLALLARGLAPLLLRRTKEEVLGELPPKTELTLYVDLQDAERVEYERLRDFYRASLSDKVESLGWSGAKIHVLEALLRLRQAACHMALIDSSFSQVPSAKLELLIGQLESVVRSGHKALVFSQFTRLLELVRRRLEAHEMTFEYLDGKTQDRQAVVTRFQNDPACGVFLISLRAGGCGLNLTSSDYVFILDPWWNPAVEAQAIDRAHRYGQERPVFAYRLIARDTVEEKILVLKDQKRRLANAILRPQGGLVEELAREDLDGLLS